MPFFPVEGLLLQGDINADGYTIHDLDKTGLELVKADVGLDQVDNTADLDKPLSTATIAALALKQDTFGTGGTGVFLNGFLNWQSYGELALEGRDTSISRISVVGSSGSQIATLEARRNDYIVTPEPGSGVKVQISQLGATNLSNILTGFPGANCGVLQFTGDAFAVIKTTNTAPIIFGVNEIRRMRLAQGLNVGGDIDPGAGCITAFGTIYGGHLSGDGSLIVGLTKNQIPSPLNSTTFPNITLNGVGGEGFVRFTNQGTNPVVTNPHVFADGSGRVALGHSGPNNKAIKFANDVLTADRILYCPDGSGTLVIGASEGGWVEWTGTGTKTAKDTTTATTQEIAEVVKAIIHVLFGYGMITA